jgi:hypothetical protein
MMELKLALSQISRRHVKEQEDSFWLLDLEFEPME